MKFRCSKYNNLCMGRSFSVLAFWSMGQMRGSKVPNGISASPLPLCSAFTTWNGYQLTMRGDIITCSSYVSLLVSGSAQTCFDDQVLKHLAPEISYRSLVALGVGLASESDPYFYLPRWSASLTKDRAKTGSESKPNLFGVNGTLEDKKPPVAGPSSLTSFKGKLKPATMRPIPHSRQQQMHPLMVFLEANAHETSQAKPNLPVAPPVKHSSVPAATAAHRKSTSSPSHAQPIVQLNPLPVKKHGCNRLPIHVCSEEDLLKDVMQFLIQRGNNPLIPHGGLAEFPDAYPFPSDLYFPGTTVFHA